MSILLAFTIGYQLGNLINAGARWAQTTAQSREPAYHFSQIEPQSEATTSGPNLAPE